VAVDGDKIFREVGASQIPICAFEVEPQTRVETAILV
jgi:hypothetical protein